MPHKIIGTLTLALVVAACGSQPEKDQQLQAQTIKPIETRSAASVPSEKTGVNPEISQGEEKLAKAKVKQKDEPKPKLAQKAKVTKAEKTKVVAKPSIANQEKIQQKPKLKVQADVVTPSTKPKLSAKVPPSEKSSQTVKKLRFYGNIKLKGKGGESLSPEGVIVLLEPRYKKGHEKIEGTQSDTRTIDMIGKVYRPGNIAIKKDDVVVFKNKDDIKHNVFSSSPNNTFDLGTYGAGKSSQIALENPGIVKVYCNIHPDMVSFIGVSEFGYHAIADSQGNFSIKNLPKGLYEITLWSPRGELKQNIYISESQSKSFTLDTANYKKVQHKNKFGKAYKKTSAFDDEWY